MLTCEAPANIPAPTRASFSLCGAFNVQEIPPEAEKAIEEELEKLSSLEKNSPEFNGTKSYLDWLTQLPWGHTSIDNFDLKKAKEVLDEVREAVRERAQGLRAGQGARRWL